MIKSFSKVLFVLILVIFQTSVSGSDTIIDSLSSPVFKYKNIVDSLERMILSSGEESKYKIYKKLYDHCVNEYPKDALAYAESGLEIATILEDSAKISEMYYDIGDIHRMLSDYNNAVINFKQSLKIREIVFDTNGIAKSLNGLGLVYVRWGDYHIAMENLLEAQKLGEERQNKKLLGMIYNNLGSLYSSMRDPDMAFEYYTRALVINEEIDEKEEIAKTYNHLGIFYASKREVDSAFMFFEKSLSLRIEINDKKGIASSLNNVGGLYQWKNKWDTTLYYYKESLKLREEIGIKQGIAASLTNIAYVYLRMGNFDDALVNLDKALKIAKDETLRNVMLKIYTYYTTIYTIQKDYKIALDYYKLYSNTRNSLFNQKSNNRIADLKMGFESDKQEKEKALLHRDIKIQKLKVMRQRNLRNYLIIVVILIIVIIFIINNRYRLKKKAHKALSAAHNVIVREKDKSEKLLLNILPVRVAIELKKYGKTEPETFENVTVLFSDFVGFTKLSTTLEPKFLIDELNELFTVFDNIMEKNKCERIKTIGDAYLGVCGLPTPDPDHAKNMIHSTLEILEYLNKRNQESEVQWLIRMGVHTGKVIGGVVGIKKYIYDVFGDTINTASRMESNSEPMRINISEITYNLTKELFVFEERQAIEVKGKGMMKMFFVNGLK